MALRFPTGTAADDVPAQDAAVAGSPPAVG
jgi:hypothetical protein